MIYYCCGVLFFDAVWKIPEARQQASKKNSFDVVWKIPESNQQQRRTVLKWCGRSRKPSSKQERRTAVAAMARARLAVHGGSGSYYPLGFCVFLFCFALLLQAGFADGASSVFLFVLMIAFFFQSLSWMLCERKIVAPPLCVFLLQQYYSSRKHGKKDIHPLTAKFGRLL